jgi:pimeloyl-ACP methyl ester carboxylesterase
MLFFLAEAIASIGIALNSFSPQHVQPTYCSDHEGIEYCYYEGSPSSHRLIYYMHGFGDGTAAWTFNYATNQVEEEWAKNQVERPHVIVFGKKVWWYTEREQGAELTAFLKWFESEQINFVPERVLYGESMGGHNAFRWDADFPELFSKMALICPAFPRSFVENPPPSEGYPPWEILAQTLISEYYKESSRPDFNPLQALADGEIKISTPQVHLIVTDQDNFGFYAGGLTLQNLLAQNKDIHESFEVQSVKHCKVDAAQLADFLVK